MGGREGRKLPIPRDENCLTPRTLKTVHCPRHHVFKILSLRVFEIHIYISSSICHIYTPDSFFLSFVIFIKINELFKNAVLLGDILQALYTEVFGHFQFPICNK